MVRPGIVLLDADSLGETNFNDLTLPGSLTIYPATSADQRIERMAGREIVITNKVVIDKEVMDACPSLRLICIAATGMNNVDLDYASQKGIVVKNVSGYSTESVVQHTFALLFCLMGHLPYYLNYVNNGSYAGSHLFTHHGRPFQELSGKKFGIIGMGTIGKRIATVATAFGAEIIYFSTSGKNQAAGYTHVPLNELLTQSDIVSIHCPLNDATINLIALEQLRLMKKNAVLLNMARGGIVNENDLAVALNEQLIAGAALDVMQKEPPDPSGPLFRLHQPERCIMTPHIAWASVESRQRLMQGIMSNIKAFLQQK